MSYLVNYISVHLDELYGSHLMDVLFFPCSKDIDMMSSIN